jgi:hypothetical protein
MNIAFLVATGVLLLSSASARAGAEEKPKVPCSDPVAHQFDFWIGRWDVTEQGKPAGTNHIERILDGCALLENWVGAQGGAGKSLNFFDQADGLWHQTWVDRSGGALMLAGKFENGAMRLEGNRPATKQQPATRQRITWTPLPGGNVRQLWESSPSDKEEWTVQFDGLYVPGK